MTGRLDPPVGGVAHDERKDGLRDALASARERSLALLGPLTPEDQERQHSPLMSPLVWDLAHVAHYEELWLVRRLTGDGPTSPLHDDIYDAFRHPRRERSRLPLLGPHEARAFAAAVRERTFEVLARVDLDPADPLLRDGFVYGMVVQHEHQHDETMLATIQIADGLVYPQPEMDPGTPFAGPEPGDEVLVDGGRFVMGTDDEPWAYDNERPAHEVHLRPFWIDASPVTNRRFAAFVDDGGYHRPELWEPEGWAFRLEAGLEHPQYWRREGSGSWLRRRFGHLEALPADEPVQHVCWYEADAYARWAGRRLPSEAEWEMAASWDPARGKRRFPWGDEPPTSERANLAGADPAWPARFGPHAAGAHPEGASPWGCHQMVGDVWEWTGSTFTGYPGFRSFPYREYSEVFLGSGYRVLRGGSWATHPSAVRTTFRNWDFPIRRQIFAGFRCARDA